jgi:hypothetical protein
MTARGAVSGLARLGGIGLGDGHVLGQVVAVVLHRKRTPLGMFDVLRFGSAALLPT